MAGCGLWGPGEVLSDIALFSNSWHFAGLSHYRRNTPRCSRTLQPVSILAEPDFHTAEPDHAEEILDVILPARDQPIPIGKPTPAKYAPIPLTRPRVLCPCREVVATARARRVTAEPFRAPRRTRGSPGDSRSRSHSTSRAPRSCPRASRAR